ncbi:MAG: response regulator [Elusimicrobiales bacterium]|nr:response regulator [Elusimicrobiales bacterium]NLH39178.1 response regulator [Elusimicrobiota bacterium]
MDTSEISKKLILIVDDDDAVRELLEIILRKEGFRVENSSNGNDAITKVKAKNPDLIILDLMLPGFGGFEILRELQSDDTHNIPVIIVTGKYMDKTTSEMIKMEPNVVDFIEKPIKTHIFISAVEKALKIKK